MKIWGLQQLWISTTATNIGAKLKIKSVTNALECLKLTRTVNILFPVTAIIPDTPKKPKKSLILLKIAAISCLLP